MRRIRALRSRIRACAYARTLTVRGRSAEAEEGGEKGRRSEERGRGGRGIPLRASSWPYGAFPCDSGPAACLRTAYATREHTRARIISYGRGRNRTRIPHASAERDGATDGGAVARIRTRDPGAANGIAGRMRTGVAGAAEDGAAEGDFSESADFRCAMSKSAIFDATKLEKHDVYNVTHVLYFAHQKKYFNFYADYISKLFSKITKSFGVLHCLHPLR